MKTLMSAGLFALASILPAFSAPGEETTDPLANAPTQYSADLVVTRKAGPPMPMTMKVYVDGNKRRNEREGNGGQIIILRGDLSKRYVLTPATKTYVEAPLDPKMLESPNDWAKRMGLVHEKVGTEEINGETCDKYQYSSDPNKTANGQNQRMPAVRAMTGFIWVGQMTHMLVKSENQVTSAEWKNIKVGPPDASLFDLPADYKKTEATQPFQLRPRGQKPQEQSEEQKSGGQSPSPAVSPSPEASASPETSPSAQKSDGDK